MHRRCWPAPKLQSGQVTQTVLASCATPLLMLRGMPAPRKDSLEVGIALDGSKYGVATVRYFVGTVTCPERHLLSLSFVGWPAG